MSPQDFCYWLQGFLEIAKPDEITHTQIEEIKNHLNLVFKKVTPNVSSPLLDIPFCNPAPFLHKNDGPIYPTIGINYLNDQPASC